MSIFLFIMGIFLFTCLILVHEYGHFKVARRNGVEVEEFGLFMPPKIYSRKLKSGLELSINAIPVGGFVRLKGEHDADKGKGSFGAATLWAKSKIMAAGVGMNLFAAFIIFTLLALIGMPQFIPNQFTIKSDTKISTQKVLVASVENNSPAAAAGLQKNDTLISVTPLGGNTTKIDSISTLPTLTAALEGQKVVISYKNSTGQTITKSTTLRSTAYVNSRSGKQSPGYLGIATTGSPKNTTLPRSTWSAPIVAIGLMWQIIVLTFQGIGHALAGLFSIHPSQATKQLTGPIGLVSILNDSSKIGINYVLFFIGLISLSLAIINILPFPALDGGRLFVTTLIPRLFTGKPLKQRTEEIINAVGFSILILMFIFISIADVQRFL